MPQKRDLDGVYGRIGALREDLIDKLAPHLIENPQLANIITRQVGEIMQAVVDELNNEPEPADDGLSALIGLGADAAMDIDDNFVPFKDFVYDDTVAAERIRAVADLYYIYQHDRIGVFETVLELQKRFNAGSIKLSDGDGAYGLFRFDRRKVLRYTRKEIRQAYRRVFGYLPGVSLPKGAKPNTDFHRLFTNFNRRVAQFYRDQRISELINPDKLDFSSVAVVRRAGLDLRNNLKNASYGHIQVMVIELWSLLNEAFRILNANDVRNLFGADTYWDVIEEVHLRYRNRPQLKASQRNRMAINGRGIINWLAQPHVLNVERTEFEALLEEIHDGSEEWLTSTQSLGTDKVIRLSSSGIASREFDLEDEYLMG